MRLVGSITKLHFIDGKTEASRNQGLVFGKTNPIGPHFSGQEKSRRNGTKTAPADWLGTLVWGFSDDGWEAEGALTSVSASRGLLNAVSSHSPWELEVVHQTLRD